MKLVAALLAALVLTLTPAAATASDPAAVSHDCLGTDVSASGLRAVVCVDGFIYEYGATPIYGIKIEFICAGRSGQVPCTGVKGLGQMYVSPYGWIGNLHRFTCGIYANSSDVCATGRNFDNYIDMIAVTYNQAHHWVGRAWNVTIDNHGTIFIIRDFRGLDYTTVPS